ncbi:hypothetical protein CONLIGDRAFT_648975 [Coniochaeta ligniaria NRRL 30616]|uniref:Uncharacterized protein n=1 Tax=Coniochaeta ligniaria NRRL 30616 TaxID=1408157 RepID=A0A1J7ISW1_9PEZI|nr:hypothetical protein CONLIGDRAFT_648975 [Coniochaeta ligniaria NRRL 30616]
MMEESTATPRSSIDRVGPAQGLTLKASFLDYRTKSKRASLPTSWVLSRKIWYARISATKITPHTTEASSRILPQTRARGTLFEAKDQHIHKRVSRISPCARSQPARRAFHQARGLPDSRAGDLPLRKHARRQDESSATENAASRSLVAMLCYLVVIAAEVSLGSCCRERVRQLLTVGEHPRRRSTRSSGLQTSFTDRANQISQIHLGRSRSGISIRCSLANHQAQPPHPSANQDYARIPCKQILGLATFTPPTPTSPEDGSSFLRVPAAYSAPARAQLRDHSCQTQDHCPLGTCEDRHFDNLQNTYVVSRGSKNGVE